MWDLLLLLLMLDSFFTYFLANFLGTSVPVNGMLILILVGLVAVFKYPPIRYMPTFGWIGLYCIIASYIAAILFLDEFGLRKLFQFFGTPLGIAIGYAAFMSGGSAASKKQVFLIVALIYSAVCLLALSKVLPQLFPLAEQYYVRDGIPGFRPEITTDPNLQILYLLPVIMLFSIRTTSKEFVALTAALGAGSFILATIETRSGVLVLTGSFVLAWLVGIRARRQLDWRPFVLILAIALLSLFFAGRILDIFQTIYLRFTVDNFTSFDNRISALTFLLEKLLEPSWWVPRGLNAYFALGFASLPHSTPTMIFVESGILGLLGWLLLVPVPLIILSINWWRGRTDDVSNIALCGGVTVLVIQLSLPEPNTESIWLWAGAVLAANARCIIRERTDLLESTRALTR